MKKITFRLLVLAAMVLGIHRVCCLEALNSFEDYARYKDIPIADFRMILNKQDPMILYLIKYRVHPDEGILSLDKEPYFISYYAYPLKVYKFKKGYFATSVRTELADVDKEWLAERNIKWTLSSGENDKIPLKKIKDSM